MANADVIRMERPSTNSRLFAHTRWDAVPTAASVFHLAYFIGLFFLYPHAPPSPRLRRAKETRALPSEFRAQFFLLRLAVLLQAADF